MDDMIRLGNRKDFRVTVGKEKEGESLYRVAVHEAGHTIAALVLHPERVPDADILSCKESLNYMRMTDTNSSFLDDIRNSVCIALAGRAAERTILGRISLCAKTDLEYAATGIVTLLTEEAVCGYKYLATASSIMNTISDKVAEELIRDFDMQMNMLDGKAERIIKEKRRAFFVIADALLEYKALPREKLVELYRTAS